MKSRSAGKAFFSWAILLRTALPTSRALVPGNWKMASATAGRPLEVADWSYLLAPSSSRAKSFSRSTWGDTSPGCELLARTMISPNSSGVERRPKALRVSCVCWPAGAGCWPSCPNEMATFCAFTALETSPAEMLWAAMRCGSSQARIE